MYSSLFALFCCVNLMDEEWNDAKYREITCILNLTKCRTKNIIDLPPNIILINMFTVYIVYLNICQVLKK